MNRSKVIAIGLVCIFIGSIFSALATRTITDTSDTIYTKIVCSNGNVYDATAANLQTAIYSLNGTGGKVTLPQCNITITNTILITSNVWLCGQGNSTVLYLGNLANVTMIKNFHGGYVSGGLYMANGNDTDIRLSDFTMNGNQYHQPKYLSSSNWYKEEQGIFLCHSHNTIIENINLYNILNAGIFYTSSNVINLNNIRANRIGTNWTTGMSSGVSEQPISSCAWFESCSNITVSNSYFNNYWNHGLAFEGNSAVTGSPWSNLENSSGIKVKNCQFDNAFSGIWFEKAHDAVITNCIIFNMTRKDNVYVASDTEPTGIFVGTRTKYINVVNCIISRCGNITTNKGQGVLLDGNNNTVDNCIINKIYGNGTVITNSNNKITRSIISNCSYNGIYIYFDANEYGFKVDDNTVFNTNKSGIYTNGFSSASRYLNKLSSISRNVISNFTTPTGTGYINHHGINNRLSNVTISGNTICSWIRDIYIDTSKNCIVSNNHVSVTSSSGIYFSSCDNCTCNDNFIVKTTSYGIGLGACSNITVNGNKITKCNSSTGTIVEVTSGNYNLISCNHVSGGNTNNAIVRLGTNTIVTNNIGYFSVQFPTSAPSTPAAGSMYVNATTGDIAVYSGTAWIWTHG